MKLVFTAAIALSATVSFAAGLPGRSITGNYMEARTADTYTGPCFANGEVEMNGKEAVFGWKINNGSWKGVDLQGLGIVGVVRSKHTLGDIHRPVNPASAVLIVDSRATAEQREALVAFAKSQAPELLSNRREGVGGAGRTHHRKQQHARRRGAAYGRLSGRGPHLAVSPRPTTSAATKTSSIRRWPSWTTSCPPTRWRIPIRAKG